MKCKVTNSKEDDCKENQQQEVTSNAETDDEVNVNADAVISQDIANADTVISQDISSIVGNAIIIRH